jgi:hypothetical protein
MGGIHQAPSASKVASDGPAAGDTGGWGSGEAVGSAAGLRLFVASRASQQASRF